MDMPTKCSIISNTNKKPKGKRTSAGLRPGFAEHFKAPNDTTRPATVTTTLVAAGERAQDPKGKGKQRAICKSTPTAQPLAHPQPEEEEDWAGVDEYTGGYHDDEDSFERDAMEADTGASRLFWRSRESLDNDDDSQQRHSSSRVSAQWPKGTPASYSTPLVPRRVSEQPICTSEH